MRQRTQSRPLSARAAGPPVTVLVTAGVGVAVLAGPAQRALPCPPPGQWLRVASRSDPAVTAMTWLRVVALVGCGYLAVVAILGLLATVTGNRTQLGVVRRLTVPALRRWVAPALLLASSRLAVPAGAEVPAPPAVVMVVEEAVPPLTMVVDPPAPRAPAPIAPAPIAPAPATVHRVLRGDNCWTIAADHLHAVRGHEPSLREVARYWRALIEANTDRFTTGDPDLIFAGQELVLPPVT